MTSTPEPLAGDAALHLLAEQLVGALADDQLPPAILYVEPDEDGFDLGVQPLEGHPTEVLLGFDAPAGWHAMGLAASGWASRTRDRGAPDSERHRVHVVTLLSRSGEHAHRTTVAGSPELSEQLTGEQPGGEQVDLLRRCLGLATDPPPCDAGVYWAIQWLAGVLSTTLPSLRTWEEALARHPAMRLLADAKEPAPEDASAEDAVEILAAFHRVCHWERLRRMTAEGRFEAPELAPDDARWLDDGSFARFLLTRCSGLRPLRRCVEEQLPASVAARIDMVLRRLDVPETAWPDIGERPAA